jgi:hypothetical protein
LTISGDTNDIPYTASFSSAALQTFLDVLGTDLAAQSSNVLNNVTSAYASLSGTTGLLYWVCELNHAYPFISGYLMSSDNKTHVAGFQFSDGFTDLLYNDTDIHALPIFLQSTLNAAIQANVTITSAPWPFSSGLSWDSSIFTTVLLLGIALSIPAGKSIAVFDFLVHV